MSSRASAAGTAAAEGADSSDDYEYAEDLVLIDFPEKERSLGSLARSSKPTEGTAPPKIVLVNYCSREPQLMIDEQLWSATLRENLHLGSAMVLTRAAPQTEKQVSGKAAAAADDTGSSALPSEPAAAAAAPQVEGLTETHFSFKKTKGSLEDPEAATVEQEQVQLSAAQLAKTKRRIEARVQKEAKKKGPKPVPIVLEDNT